MSWSHLIRQALVGTGRVANPDQTLLEENREETLGDFLNRLDLDDPAKALLVHAGVKTLYEDAATRPVQLAADRPRHFADRDDRPLCPEEVTKILEHILNGQNRVLLEPFLDQFHKAGWRMPEYLVPNLLAYGGRIHRYQSKIIRILGPHGRWLAAHNPKWTFGTLDVSNWTDLLNRWQNSKLTEQTRLLELVRFFDPKIGRQLLETHWKSQSKNSKLYFLRQLEFGLSMDDEPFLERALDDRELPIRKQAAKLLTQLPESRYAKRMGQYLTEIIEWKPGRFGGRGKLNIAFPAQPSPQMIRDGIPPIEKRRPGFYIKQQLLTIVSAAPLSTWQTHWQVDPERVIDAVMASGWTKTLITGLSKAVWQQREAGSAWALPLCRADQFSKGSIKLIALIPEEDQEEIIHVLLEQWQDEPLGRNFSLKGLWRDWPYPWSDGIARQMTHQFAQYVVSQKDAAAIDLSVRALYMKFMRQVSTSQQDDIEEILEEAIKITPLWRNEVYEGLSLLKFRDQMEKAFTNS